MSVPFLMVANFYAGKFLHFCPSWSLSLLSDKGTLCVLCTMCSRGSLEDPLDFQAIIVVCVFLSLSKIPHFSSLQIWEICCP